MLCVRLTQRVDEFQFSIGDATPWRNDGRDLEIYAYAFQFSIGEAIFIFTVITGLYLALVSILYWRCNLKPYCESMSASNLFQFSIGDA